MPPQEKFNKKSPVFPAQNKILLKATRILAYSVRERRQDYAHEILMKVADIMSVFCHAALVFHVPRRGKIHVFAHLIASCIEECVRI